MECPFCDPLANPLDREPQPLALPTWMP
jgi:hypothetical protein